MSNPNKLSGARTLTAALLVGVTFLAGCATYPVTKKQTNLGYDLPLADRSAPELDKIFACIKGTGALAGQGFAIGPFNNDTGKGNSSAIGATGSFIPNGPNLSIYAVEAIARSGGVAFDYSNLDVVKNMSLVGGPKAIERLHRMQNANMPSYSVSVFATALDFDAVQRGDLRFGGLGPTFTKTSARSYYAAHIVQPGSQISLARGFAMYKADYVEGGLGVSRFFGGGTGTLVSGNISFASQEPLQRPTAEGVMLSVAFALLEIPALSACKHTVTDFLPETNDDAEAAASTTPTAPEASPGT